MVVLEKPKSTKNDYQSQYDRLHSSDIPESDLGDVKGADHVGPAVGVGSFQGPILVGAKLAALKGFQIHFIFEAGADFGKEPVLI